MPGQTICPPAEMPVTNRKAPLNLASQFVAYRILKMTQVNPLSNQEINPSPITYLLLDTIPYLYNLLQTLDR